jgi:DNA repair protein RecN (Recombination protein N)
MEGVEFKVSIETSQSLDDFSMYGPEGIDKVIFLLSPNPGLSLKPLAKIASGGETSRIFLALKKVLTERRKNGTLIFDEVDAGVSGAVAQLVGLKLKELAKNFQVFCITHHAQIASLADQHFYVAKEVRKNQTFTRVRCLNQAERIQEVARLMGGLKISQKNLDLAKEMLTH